MNIEHFHNELAIRLGYERIMKNGITIEESENPIVTLRAHGYDDISFQASKGPDVLNTQISPELKEIIDAVHRAYIDTLNSRF